MVAGTMRLVNRLRHSTRLQLARGWSAVFRHHATSFTPRVSARSRAWSSGYSYDAALSTCPCDTPHRRHPDACPFLLRGRQQPVAEIVPNTQPAILF